VGFYDDQVLPRLINVMLGNREFAKVRDEVCADLHGDVVEIGYGSGLSIPHLPAAVTGLWGVDPAAVGRKLAAKRVAASTIPIHEAGLDAQRLDLPDDRFDCALSTMTLCTIPDVQHALGEVRRVLKPGGSFHFAEHGLSPDAKVAHTQDRFDGLEQRIAGGCHLNRDIRTLVTDSGLEIESLRNFYLKGPKAWSYMNVGIARNP
jgi:ubiquinone/menaquinone biosynthesis C-methylase UbiE